MPVTECLKIYMADDDTGETASAVSARNSAKWPTAADVPDYAYKPLTQILIGAAGDTDGLLKRY